MSEGLPFSRPYNLNRLGQAGDTVDVAISDQERTQLAQFVGVPRVDAFSAKIELKKLGSNRFQLNFSLTADICQSCVVTLVDVPAHIERHFVRELHFNPALHRGEQPAAENIPLEDDVLEEIGSLHYDLAAALIEELVLGVDPYPRAPGAAFEPPGSGEEPPENPFAVLKGLKSGL